MGIRPTYAPGSNQPYTITSYQPVPVPPPAHQQVCACPDHNAPPATAYYAPVPSAPRSVAPYVAGGVGAVVAVVTVGAIAIGLLLAFAVSALALAVVAAVLKSLLNNQSGPRR